MSCIFVAFRIIIGWGLVGRDGLRDLNGEYEYGSTGNVSRFHVDPCTSLLYLLFSMPFWVSNPFHFRLYFIIPRVYVFYCALDCHILLMLKLNVENWLL